MKHSINCDHPLLEVLLDRVKKDYTLKQFQIIQCDIGIGVSQVNKRDEEKNKKLLNLMEKYEIRSSVLP